MQKNALFLFFIIFTLGEKTKGFLQEMTLTFQFKVQNILEIINIWMTYLVGQTSSFKKGIKPDIFFNVLAANA